jgi:20S proteasome alpha/beta subunit
MNDKQTIRLAVETLLEVVESAKNIEICVVYPGNKSEMLDEENIDIFVKEIEKEREEAEAAKQK